MNIKDLAEMIDIAFGISLTLCGILWLCLYLKLEKIYDELKEIRKGKKMTNKELIDYCNMDKEDCYFCPYDRKECDLFIKETGYAPWTYRKNDEEFLSREVGKSE